MRRRVTRRPLPRASRTSPAAGTSSSLPRTAARTPSGVSPTSESSLRHRAVGARSSRAPRGAAPAPGDARSASASHTAAPKPPMPVFSSMVTTSRWFDAAHETVSRSSGLTQRALTTLAETPSAASSSAASSATLDHAADGEQRDIACPSRRTCARPASHAAGSAGVSTPRAGAARVADRDRAVGGERGVQRLGELGLVGGREHHHVRDGAQVREVEHAVMRRAVLAHEPGAVQAEDHVQVLQRDVHDQLVVGALQERRVDRDDRQHARRARGRRPGRPRAPRRCRRRRSGRGSVSAKRSSPVPEGIAAVIATMRSSRLGLGDERARERLGEAHRRRRRRSPCRSRPRTARCRGMRPAGPRRARSRRPCASPRG